MTEHTIRRRRMGGAMVGLAALALPLTASFSYAQSEVSAVPDAPVAPEPPAAAEAPVAPLPPEPVIMVHRVKAPEGGEGEKKVERRVVIVRDGKAEHLDLPKGDGTRPMRFLFRGEDGKPLDPNDPKIKERMKRLEERLATLDKDIAGSIVIDEKKMGEFRDRAHKLAEMSVRMAPRIEMSCDEGDAATETKTEDGRKVIRVCRRAIMGSAVGGLRAAREAIAGNEQMSAETRKEVLDKLDREIERLESERRG